MQKVMFYLKRVKDVKSKKLNIEDLHQLKVTQ